MHVGTRPRTVGRALTAAIALAACMLTIALPRPARAATPAPGFGPADAAMRARVRADHLEGGALVVRRGAEVLHDATFGDWTLKTVVPIASASKWLPRPR